MRAPSLEPLLTVADVQRVLRIGRSQVYRLIAAEDLPSVRVGARLRFRPTDIAAYLARDQQHETPESWRSGSP